MEKRKLILFCCFLAGADSAVYLAQQNEIQDHPNQCYDKSQTVFYDKGDTMINEQSDKICGKKVCLGKDENSGRIITSFSTCGVVDGPKRQIKTCNVTETLGPYPDCCVPHENVVPPDFCESRASESDAGQISVNRIRRGSVNRLFGSNGV